MKALKVFLLGLMYGWVIKFLIDRIYRTDEIEAMRTENVSLKQYIHSLERQVRQKTPASQSVTPVAAQAVQPSAPVRTGTKKDDLKLLRGVGPTIEKRLNNAGIYTFAEIARLTPEEIEEILGTLRRVTGRELIDEARRRARQK